VKKLPLIALCLILFSCASPSDVDFSGRDSECSQRCHANYSTCLSAFSLFPIMQNNQCVAGLGSCAQSCQGNSSPMKAGEKISAVSMEQAKAKCLELGFKASTDSFGQCLLKISK